MRLTNPFLVDSPLRTFRYCADATILRNTTRSSSGSALVSLIESIAFDLLCLEAGLSYALHMDIDWVREHCLSLAYTTEQIQW